MKFIIVFVFGVLAAGKVFTQTNAEIILLKIKKINSYDESYGTSTTKYDTTMEQFDSAGRRILKYTTLLIKDTSLYIYTFDSLGRENECKSISGDKTFTMYRTTYKSDGGFYRIMDEESLVEERREYNKQGNLISSFSESDKHKTIFTLDSMGNYIQQTTVYKDKPDKVIKFNLSYNKSGQLVKRSAEKSDGDEIIFEYNEKGLPRKITTYPNKKKKDNKWVRTKTYEFY